MRKGLRGFVDDALSRTGPLAVEKSGDFPTARPFAHKLHRALFVSYNILEGQNQPHHRSVDRNWQGSTYQRTFSVQTNGATSQKERGGNNAMALFGMHQIPCAPQIRNLLDPVSPEHVTPLLMEIGEALHRLGGLANHRLLAGSFAVALDGVEYTVRGHD